MSYPLGDIRTSTLSGAQEIPWVNQRSHLVLVLALAGSLLLHLGLLTYLSLQQANMEPAIPTRTIELSLFSEAPHSSLPLENLIPKTPAEEEEVVEEEMVDAAAESAVEERPEEGTIARTGRQGSNSPANAPLDQSLGDQKSSRDEVNPASRDPNRATIFDPGVQKQLADAQKMPRGAAELPEINNLDHGQNRYLAGSWSEWVRFGDRCFHWVQANPLEPFSQDQWFAADCKTGKRRLRPSWGSPR